MANIFVERGKDLGLEEGYSVGKEAFNEIIKFLKAKEAPKINASDASTQTDIQMTATTTVGTQTKPNTSVSFQMQPIFISTPSSTTIGSKRILQHALMSRIAPCI